MIVAESQELLHWLVSMFGLVCKRRKIKMNVKKTKVIWCNTLGIKGLLLRLNEEPLKEVDSFRYLRMKVAVNG